MLLYYNRLGLMGHKNGLAWIIRREPLTMWKWIESNVTDNKFGCLLKP